jgi:hypothetical protein
MQRSHAAGFFLCVAQILRGTATAFFFSFAFASAVLPAIPAAASSILPEPIPLVDDGGTFTNYGELDSGPVEPLLTILYNADTNGEMFPCPT